MVLWILAYCRSFFRLWSSFFLSKVIGVKLLLLSWYFQRKNKEMWGESEPSFFKKGWESSRWYSRFLSDFLGTFLFASDFVLISSVHVILKLTSIFIKCFHTFSVIHPLPPPNVFKTRMVMTDFGFFSCPEAEFRFNESLITQGIDFD